MSITATLTLSVSDILALAPDEQAAKSARGLARPAKWQALACSEQAIWGQYKGSGQSPYEVIVDFGSGSPAFECSCPSYKHPCKHALGLLLLAQANPGMLPAAEPPEWVTQWLAERAERAAKKASAAAKKAAAVAQKAGKSSDARPQSRRAETRMQRIQQGIDALSLWLQDLIRRGLGSLQNEPLSFWETQAARLVDAQAPGLARRVRRLPAILVGGSSNGARSPWPDRLLAALSQLDLLIQAFQRLDTFPQDLQEEIRSQIGWTQEQADLLALPGVSDRWLALGQRTSIEDPLQVRSTWLWGTQRQQAALLLDFASPGRTFEHSLAPGLALDAELVFWRGAWPQRVLIRQQKAISPIQSISGYPSIRAALDAFAAALGGNPWLDRFLMPLDGVLPQPHGDGWMARDVEDRLLPLSFSPDQGWRLLALSGGNPLTLIGEWDGAQLDLLSVWDGQTLIGMERTTR